MGKTYEDGLLPINKNSPRTSFYVETFFLSLGFLSLGVADLKYILNPIDENFPLYGPLALMTAANLGAGFGLVAINSVIRLIKPDNAYGLEKKLE